MRISDHLVMRFVESDPPTLALIHDLSDKEVAITAADIPKLRDAMSREQAWGDLAQLFIGPMGTKLCIPFDAWPAFVYALDHFEPHLV